jgi:hypothetical protein
MEPFTSDRDLKKVLDYLFSIYDANSDGNLTETEIKKILGGWCKIIVNLLWENVFTTLLSGFSTFVKVGQI